MAKTKTKTKAEQSKLYRFFYHYNKPSKSMSVHFKGRCHIVTDVVCRAPCETKRNKTQPTLVMQGFAHDVIPLDDGDLAVIV